MPSLIACTTTATPCCENLAVLLAYLWTTNINDPLHLFLHAIHSQYTCYPCFFLLLVLVNRYIYISYKRFSSLVPPQCCIIYPSECPLLDQYTCAAGDSRSLQLCAEFRAAVLRFMYYITRSLTYPPPLNCTAPLS